MLQTDTMINAGVSESDIRQLQDAWNAYQNARETATRQKPHILCTGIYNAGKSTLLNALLGEEKFPTGDIPTTKATARAESNGAVYTDTPGLNAAAEDDQETQTAYESADFILFVSSAENGGITESEALWLQRLRDRYTPESLKLRITYVLTHCAQVDLEQLPAIREKVCGDISKTVGFEPEQIFCVDSITYQEGTETHEPLLITNSGIPQLQAYLSERIKKADALLEQVRTDELEQRRRELLGRIGQLRDTVQEPFNSAAVEWSRHRKNVDQVWKDFEEKLEKEIPAKEITPIPHQYIRLAKSQSGKASSLLECSQKVKNALRPIYDSMQGKVQDAANQSEKAALKYCTTGMDSVYFASCNKINQVFEEAVMALQKQGIPISGGPEISVNPNLPDDFRDTVMGYLYQYSVKQSMLSLGTYVDKYVWLHELGEPYETKDYRQKRGLFGGMKDYEVTVYYYDIYNSSRYMEENLQRAVDSNIDMANNYINLYWKEFQSSLKFAANERKATLKRQMDTYCGAPDYGAGGLQSLQSMLDYLDYLKQEVS